ncbi:MAG: carboxypeptidase regulatory-like domain-containing protein [Dehalococcoidia bacterium]|nr:carboxypeptidase regulatory-like domain-containing protein [Dehalococcoidia bacterium]
MPATTLAQSGDGARYRIEGKVVGPDEEPVAGMEVSATRTDPWGLTFITETGADGRFGLEVREGPYVFQLGIGDCGFGWHGADGSSQPVSDGHPRVPTIAVRGADVTGIVFKLAVSPASKCGVIRATVRGANNEPLEGIRLTGIAVFSRHNEWLKDTDSEGRAVETAGLDAFRVSVRHDDCFLGWYQSDGGLAKRMADASIVTLDAGRDLELAIAIPSALSDLCTVVEGVVTDAEGRPLENHRLYLSTHETWTRGAGKLLRTAADGTFRTEVGEGQYRFNMGGMGVCTVQGGAHVDERGTASVIVAGQAIRGIHLTLSEPSMGFYTYTVCLAASAPVTTEVQPELNLVGWTGAKANVTELFDAIPQLEVVYAWDGDAQRFKWASRSGASVAGDLEAVEPGMGLWLTLGGTEPFTWTREGPRTARFGFDSEIPGLHRLSEGWNLVGWAGHGAIPADDAFASLGSDLVMAAGWDPEAREFLRYDPDDPESSTIDLIDRGDGLWLLMSSERNWLQPGAVTPAMEYHSGALASQWATSPELVDEVVTYFAERYGLVAPGLTIMQLPRGLGYCQSSVSGEIVLIYGCEDADFFAPAFAHEYARSLQHHLTEIVRPYASWLWTGITQYLQAQYLTRHGPSYEEHVRLRVVPRARSVTAPLRDMAGVIRANFDVAHLAVRLLVELTEEEALFEFVASLPVLDWEDAFPVAFGMSLDEFYEVFAVHRAEVAPPR